MHELEEGHAHISTFYQVLRGRRVIAVYSRLRSLKFDYSGSRDLAGQALLFLSGFLFSFFAPPISLVSYFTCIPELKKEGLRRRLASNSIGVITDCNQE